MFIDGAYVRLKIAPKTRTGTIHNSDRDGQWLFRQDPRIISVVEDVYVFEDEVALCTRPSDAEIFETNALIKEANGLIDSGDAAL